WRLLHLAGPGGTVRRLHPGGLPLRGAAPTTPRLLTAIHRRADDSHLQLGRQRDRSLLRRAGSPRERDADPCVLPGAVPHNPDLVAAAGWHGPDHFRGAGSTGVGVPAAADAGGA